MGFGFLDMLNRMLLKESRVLGIQIEPCKSELRMGH